MSKSTSKQISPKEQVSNIVGSISKLSEIIQEKHQDFLHTKHKDLKDADLEEYEIVKKYIEDLKPLVCASKLKKEIIEFLEDQALKIDRGAEVSDEIMESMLDNYTLKLSEYTNIVTSQIENGYFDEDDKLDILTILKKTLSPEYEAKYGYSLLHMAAFYNRIAMFKSIFNFGKILDEKFDLKEFDVIDKKSAIWAIAGETVDKISYEVVVDERVFEVKKSKYAEGSGGKNIVDYLLERNIMSSKFLKILAFLKSIGIYNCGPNALIKIESLIPINDYLASHKGAGFVEEFLKIVHFTDHDHSDNVDGLVGDDAAPSASAGLDA